jgi:hypothetical protein
MPKFWVLVSTPTIYQVEAETKKEAARDAVERYHNTLLDPDVKVAEIKTR